MSASSHFTLLPLSPYQMSAVLGGALKRTTCGRWVHPTCALWLPETSLDATASYHVLNGLVQGVQQVCLLYLGGSADGRRCAGALYLLALVGILLLQLQTQNV